MVNVVLLGLLKRVALKALPLLISWLNQQLMKIISGIPDMKKDQADGFKLQLGYLKTNVDWLLRDWDTIEPKVFTKDKHTKRNK